MLTPPPTIADATELTWQRLPLQGASNVRELGGYPVSGGGQTRYHRFLRADRLDALTDADVAFLKAYGVTSIFDLRDPNECERQPDRLWEGVAYENICLLEFDMSNTGMVQRYMDGTIDLDDFYGTILGNHDAMGRLFRAIAAAPEGCVLFHCAVGKDRTGITAALLMLLAGCDRGDCEASYVQTWHHIMRMEGFRRDWLSREEDPLRWLAESRPEMIAYALDHIEGVGGAVAYLQGCGVSWEEIAAIRARLLEA